MSTPSKKLLSSTLFLSMLFASLQPAFVYVAVAQTTEPGEDIEQEKIAEAVADLEPIAATEDSEEAALSTMVLDDGTEVQVKGLIIKYKDTPTEAEADETLESVAITPEPEPYFGLFTDEDAPIEDELEIVHFEEECGQHDIEARIEILEQEENIEYVEPNVVVSLLSTEPKDPRFSDQWALPAIRAPEAWDIQTGSTDTVIALIDTGINSNHPDAPVSLLPGYDVFNDDAHPNDDHGHGTAMASIIAASTNNEVGIAGACPRCSILPIKALDEHGGSTFDVIAEAVRFAADNGAHIINLSLGAPFDSKTMREAIEYAQSKDALVIAAGGNSSSETVMFPAGYQNVLGVGATDQNNAKASFSNTGPHIDVVAPGVNILSHTSGGGFGEVHGSSPAAAHVAGVAGLIKSQKPSSDASFIATSIVETAEDIDAEGRDDQFGYGLVDARSSLFYEGLGGFEDGNAIETDLLPSGINQDYLKYFFTTHNKKAEIEEFIDRFGGNALKNYRGPLHGVNSDSENLNASFSEIIWNNGGYNFTEINRKVTLVLMELTNKAITSDTLDDDVYKNIFGFTLEDMRSDERLSWWHDKIRVDELADQISLMIWKSSGSLPLGTVIFPDGSQVDANNNFVRFFAEFASSREELEHWLSFEEGSFFYFYDQWFGLPIGALDVSTTNDSNENIADDFLKSAYEQAVFCGFTAFFDHDTPEWNNNHNDWLVLFTGQGLDTEFPPPGGSSRITNGYNGYDTHTGIDALIRHSCPNGGSADVLSAYEGTYSKRDDKEFGYGKQVRMYHDIDEDEHPDLFTLYGHLNSFNENLPTLTDFIETGFNLGTEGNTGFSFGPHLHFEVRRLITNESGEVVSSVVIDPWGWWGNYADPWENHANGTRSDWLFKTSNYVDYNHEDSRHSFLYFGTAKDSQGGAPERLHWRNTGNALWTHTKNKEEVELHGKVDSPNDKIWRTWDNWAFWAGKTEQSGKHVIQAFIPSETVDEKIVSPEARYTVFEKQGENNIHHPVSINQQALAGRWASLGTYDLEQGVKSAVRLVDEVSEEEDHSKIIWADAVRWVQEKMEVRYDNGAVMPNNSSAEFKIKSDKDQIFTVHKTTSENLKFINANIVGPGAGDFRLIQKPEKNSILNSNPHSITVRLEGNLNQNNTNEAVLYIFYKDSDDQEQIYSFTLVGDKTIDTLTDVPQDLWAYPYIRLAVREGVIGGFEDANGPTGEFKPAEPASRAQILKMAMTAKGIDITEKVDDPGFSDVNPEDWFYLYVAHGKEEGYIEGTNIGCPNNNSPCFLPNKPVIRYEAAKIFHAVLTSTDYRTNQTCSDSQFSSLNSVFFDIENSWYCPAVYWLANTKVRWQVTEGKVDEKPIVEGYSKPVLDVPEVPGKPGKKLFPFGGYELNSENNIIPAHINRAEASKILALTMVQYGTAQSQGSVPTLGRDFEQVIDNTNQNPPSKISLPGGNTQTVQGSYAFDLPTHDSDGDRLFYYYVADGGTFEVIDNNYFAKARWIAPEVTSTTSFTVHITAGDGRGLIQRSSIQFTVEPGGHAGDDICTEVAASSIELLSNNPEKLEPATLTKTTLFLDGEDDPSKPALEVEEVQVEELSINTLASDVQDISFYDNVTEETIEWSPDLSQAQPALVEVDGVNAQGWSNVTSLNGNNAFPGGLWKRYDNNATDGNVTWDRVTCKGFSNTTSFWSSGIGNPRPDCNRHPNNQDSWLVYGPFDLSDASNADFTFRHYTDTVEDDDRFYWMASGNGTSWSTNSYTTRSGQWRRVTKNLNSYLGDSSVWIAFRFQADQSRNGEGAYVDDLILRKFTKDFPNLSSFNYAGPSQSSLPPGELLTASFGVKNYGQSASNGGVLKVYLKQGSPVFSDNYKIDEESLGSFSSFQDRSYLLRYNLPHSLSPGQYSLYWYIDANNNVEETSESDNKFVDYITITDKPDPSINSVRVTPSALKPGETLRSIIQVENEGGAVMPAHTLYSYFSKDHVSYNSSDRFGQAISITEANPGTSKTYAQNVTIPPGTPSGTYYVSYELQPWFAEKTTSNNRKAYQITVLSDAEIVVHEANVNQQVFLSGQNLQLSADIKNQGTAATTPFTVSYYLASNTVSFSSDQRIGSTHIGTLPVNGVQPVSFDYTIPDDIEAGQYEACIYADSENTNIEEFDGHHNRHCASVTIEHPQRPDLRTLCIETSAHTAQRGDSITLSTKVINTGEVTAPSSSLQFLVAHNSDQLADASVVATRTLESLSSGNHQRVDIDYNIPTNADYGTYTVFAVANPDEVFRESAHDNNVALATFAINDPTPPQDPQPTPNPDPQDPPSDDQPEGNEEEDHNASPNVFYPDFSGLAERGRMDVGPWTAVSDEQGNIWEIQSGAKTMHFRKENNNVFFRTEGSNHHPHMQIRTPENNSHSLRGFTVSKVTVGDPGFDRIAFFERANNTWKRVGTDIPLTSLKSGDVILAPEGVHVDQISALMLRGAELEITDITAGVPVGEEQESGQNQDPQPTPNPDPQDPPSDDQPEGNEEEDHNASPNVFYPDFSGLAERGRMDVGPWTAVSDEQGNIWEIQSGAKTMHFRKENNNVFFRTEGSNHHPHMQIRTPENNSHSLRGFTVSKVTVGDPGFDRIAFFERANNTWKRVGTDIPLTSLKSGDVILAPEGVHVDQISALMLRGAELEITDITAGVPVGEEQESGQNQDPQPTPNPDPQDPPSDDQPEGNEEEDHNASPNVFYPDFSGLAERGRMDVGPWTAVSDEQGNIWEIQSGAKTMHFRKENNNVFFRTEGSNHHPHMQIRTPENNSHSLRGFTVSKVTVGDPGFDRIAFFERANNTWKRVGTDIPLTSLKSGDVILAPEGVHVDQISALMLRGAELEITDITAGVPVGEEQESGQNQDPQPTPNPDPQDPPSDDQPEGNEEEDHNASPNVFYPDFSGLAERGRMDVGPWTAVSDEQGNIWEIQSGAKTMHFRKENNNVFFRTEGSNHHPHMQIRTPENNSHSLRGFTVSKVTVGDPGFDRIAFFERANNTWKRVGTDIPLTSLKSGDVILAPEGVHVDQISALMLRGAELEITDITAGVPVGEEQESGQNQDPQPTPNPDPQDPPSDDQPEGNEEEDHNASPNVFYPDFSGLAERGRMDVGPWTAVSDEQGNIWEIQSGAKTMHFRKENNNVFFRTEGSNHHPHMQIRTPENNSHSLRGFTVSKVTVGDPGFDRIAFFERANNTWKRVGTDIPLTSLKSGDVILAPEGVHVDQISALMLRGAELEITDITAGVPVGEEGTP